MIRVVLADDDRLVRGGLRILVDDEPDLDVVGAAADGAEALAVCAATDPDVVLMDVRMTGMDGIEATRRLTARGARPKVLVVTTFGNEEYVYDALVLPAETRRLVETHARRAATRAARRVQETLTTREAQILRLVAAGYANAEIAAELVLGAETAKSHVASILAKIGVRDRTQAVIVAYETGFVQPQGRTPRRG